MPDFQFTARSLTGELLDGALTAPTRMAAILQLEKQGKFPIKIEAISTEGESKVTTSNRTAQYSKSGSETTQQSHIESSRMHSIRHSQPHLFTEQLAHLLGAGLTLDKSLGILAQRLRQPRLRGLSHSERGNKNILLIFRSESEACDEFLRWILRDPTSRRSAFPKPSASNK